MPDLRLYNSDGTVNGSNVYTLICQDDGPMYIKIGVSDRPLQRFSEIRGLNPVKPRTLAVMNISSRPRAFEAEAALHRACKKWHHSLEWFRVTTEEFKQFRAVCNKVLGRYGTDDHRRKWVQFNAQELVKEAARNQRNFVRRMKASPVFAQFVADGGRT